MFSEKFQNYFIYDWLIDWLIGFLTPTLAVLQLYRFVALFLRRIWGGGGGGVKYLMINVNIQFSAHDAFLE